MGRASTQMPGACPAPGDHLAAQGLGVPQAARRRQTAAQGSRQQGAATGLRAPAQDSLRTPLHLQPCCRALPGPAGPPSTVGFVPTRFGSWADQTPRCGRFWLLVSVVTESLYFVCSSFSECSVGSCRASLPRSSINREIRHSDEQDLTTPSFTNLTEVHVVNGKCEPRGDRG